MTPTLLPRQVFSGREHDPEARSVFRCVESQHLDRFDHIELLAVPTEVRRPTPTGPKFARRGVQKPHLLRPPLAPRARGSTIPSCRSREAAPEGVCPAGTPVSRVSSDTRGPFGLGWLWALACDQREVRPGRPSTLWSVRRAPSWRTDGGQALQPQDGRPLVGGCPVGQLVRDGSPSGCWNSDGLLSNPEGTAVPGIPG